MKLAQFNLPLIAASALLIGSANAATSITEDFEGITPPALPSGWSDVGTAANVTTAANGDTGNGNALNIAVGPTSYLVNSGVGFSASSDISGSFDFYIVDNGATYENGAFFFGDVQTELGTVAGDNLHVDLREKTFGARANILDADGTTLFDGSDNNAYTITSDTWYSASFTWTAATSDFSFSWGANGPMTVSSYSLNSDEVFFGFGTVQSGARFDNIDITGEAYVVPEPSTTALLGLGGLALILRRRK